MPNEKATQDLPFTASVLVVNDFPVQVEALSLLLRKAGYHVLTASDGREGFEVARADHPDMVISDVVMPHMDGIELCRHIRSNPELRTLPVLLVSSIRKDSESVSEGLKAGADDYMEVPYYPDRLTARVAQLVEHRRTEGALLDSQAQLSMIVESAMDAIIIVGDDGRIRLFNRAAEKMFRCSASEVIGYPLNRFVPERFRTAYEEHIKGLGDKDVNGELMRTCALIYGLRADGEEFPIEASVSQTETDGLKLFTVILRDITERRQTEERLETSESRFRQLAENINEVFWVVGMEEGKLLYVSPAYEEIWGRTCQSAYTRPDSYLEAVHPEDIEAALVTFEQPRRGETADAEYRVVRPDGSVRWVHDHAFPIKDEEGKVIRIVGVAEDITERKRAEETLHRQHVFTAAITDSLGEGVYALDADGRATFVNPAAEVMLGLKEEEVLGLPMHETIHFQRADATRVSAEECPILRVLRTGESTRIEDDVFTRRDGTLLPVTYTSSPIITDGQVAGAVVAFHDTTERRRAEQSLRESEGRFRAIFERAGMGITTATLEGHLIDTNRVLQMFLGYDEEELRGMSYEEVTHPDDLEVERVLLNEIMSGERDVYQREKRYVRKDGQVVWGNLIVSLVRDSEAAPQFVVAMVEDITERKRIEMALHQSEESYRDLVENAKDIIYTHDLEGNYTSVNRAAERILGYTREEALRLNFARTLAPEYLEKTREMIAKKLAGDNETVYQLEVFAKDGRRVALEVNTRLLLQDGVPVGIQGIARDVTVRHQLEEQLRQAQKMEAVGRLAGGVAHDFNNLLTVISGYTALALRRLKPDDPLSHNITEVSKAAERAASLTRQLLAFSRKQVLQPKVIDLNVLITELEKMLHRMIGEDVEFKTVLGTELGEVKIDPGQMEQVLMNLAVNARDAMPQGGRLTIETRSVHLDEGLTGDQAIAPGRFILLSVSDTGCGMDAETQRHIFDPFFTTKGQGKGTGLGLSTVHGIVSQSGGHIRVSSAEGRGTTFHIYLPVADEHLTEREAKDHAEPSAEGAETVLLVEDEETVCRIVRQVLELSGYKVILARNAAEAIRLCEVQEDIDLLLTDLVMPGMNGRELSERLSQSRPGIRVLFMSGYTDDVIVRHGLLDRKIDFIQKPFTPDALSRKVREVLDAPPGD